MANTLLWYSACATRGIEEWGASSGSPTVSTTVNSGDRSYILNGAATAEYLVTQNLGGGGSWQADNKTVIATIRFPSGADLTPSTAYDLLSIGDYSSSSANYHVKVVVATDGDLEVVGYGGTVLATLAQATHSMTTDTWYTLRLDADLDFNPNGQVKLTIDGGTAASNSACGPFGSTSGNWTKVGIHGPAAVADGDVLFDAVAIWDTDTTFAPTDLPDTIEKSIGYQGADGSGFTSYTETGEGPDTGAIGDAGELPIATGAGSEAFYDTGSVAKGEGVATDGSSRAGPSGDSDLSGATILGAKYMYWLDRQGGGGTTYYAYYGTKDETGGAAWYTNLDVVNPDVGSSYGWWDYFGDSADLPTTSEYLAFGVRADGSRDLYIGEMYGSILYEPAAGAPANKHHIHLPLMGVG